MFSGPPCTLRFVDDAVVEDWPGTSDVVLARSGFLTIIFVEVELVAEVVGNEYMSEVVLVSSGAMGV